MTRRAQLQPVPPPRARTLDERLDDIEAMLAELVGKRRANRVAAVKRATTLAHRAAAGITHQPTELQRAYVRSRNRTP
jgi:hypothetical protein